MTLTTGGDPQVCCDRVQAEFELAVCKMYMIPSSYPTLPPILPFPPWGGGGGCMPFRLLLSASPS